MRLLLIGSLPPPLGGTTVLFKQLVDELSSLPDVSVSVIDTALREAGRTSHALYPLRVFTEMLRTVPKVDVVSFHASMKGASLFGPLVWLVCRIFGKKWIFRGFGGVFDSWYSRSPKLRQWLFRHTVLRANILLFETKASVRNLQELTSRKVQWYANSRPYIAPVYPNQNAARGVRFVYVGHVKATKGVREIIESGEMLDDMAMIDIYGPLLEGVSEANFHGKKTRYRGMLQPEEVIPTMRQYDALLLPTYHEGEGYPGVILEAYCAGLAVIATRWGSIPEIVDDGAGILIDPRNATQLAQAMQSLIDSPQRLAALRQGALAMARQFSSQIWTERFVQLNRRLMEAA